jgi:phosphoglycerate dehydrogenase-like enzyme
MGLEVVRRIGARGKLSEDELIAALPGVFATLAGSEPYTERVFRSAPDLRIVSRWGVGFDAIDVAAATRHGVLVATAVGANHTRRSGPGGSGGRGSTCSSGSRSWRLGCSSSTT